MQIHPEQTISLTDLSFIASRRFGARESRRCSLLGLLVGIGIF